MRKMPLAMKGKKADEKKGLNRYLNGKIIRPINTCLFQLAIIFLLAGFAYPASDEALFIDEAGNLKLQKGVPVNEFSSDVTLEGNSDRAVPTEKAVKNYIDARDKEVQTHIEDKLQHLDYVYAGSQVIAESWKKNMKANDTATIASGYDYRTIGSPLIPNPDPNNYKLFYYLSAEGSTGGAGGAQLTVNGIKMLGIHTWSKEDHRYAYKSAFFYLEQFPGQPSHGYSKNGLNFGLQNLIAQKDVRIFGLTVHYVYIRKNVAYSKVDGLKYASWDELIP